MRRTSPGLASCLVLVLAAAGCNPREREQANQKTAEAEAKVKQGAADLRKAGAKAGAKLDEASVVAKVKAKLLNDVGLSTATAVDVDAKGSAVILRGTVTSEDEKQRAGQAAQHVDGVTTVVNALKVAPK